MKKIDSRLPMRLSLLSFLFLSLIPHTDAASDSGQIWNTFFQTGSLDTALSEFGEAAKANEADALAQAGLAYLTPGRESEEAALDHFLAALKHSVSRPEALLYLYEAAGQASEPDDLRKVLSSLDERLADSALPVELRDAVTFRRAQILKRLGRWSEAEEAYSTLGFLSRFWTIGPFENAEKGGHNRAFDPEQKIDLAASYPAKRRTVGWRPLPIQPYDGYINLHNLVYPSQEATSYLAASLLSTADQRCRLSLGHAGALKVWLNGKLLADINRYHSAQFDQVNLDARLQAGPNALLIKLSSGEQGGYGLYARLRPETQGSVQAASADDASVPPDFSAHAPSPDQESPDVLNLDPEPVRQLKAEAEAGADKPYISLLYARLLQHLDVVDENDPSVTAIFNKISSSFSENAFLLRLLGDSEKLPNRRQLAYRQALKKDPADRQAFLHLLEFYRQSPYATQGFDLIQSWQKEREVPAPARLAEAHMLNEAGLQEAAYDVLKQKEEDLGVEGRWQRFGLSRSWLTPEQEQAELDSILQADPVNMNALLARRDIDLRQGREDSLAASLEQERRINPFSLSGDVDLAKYYQAAERWSDALSVLENARRVSPDDFEVHRISAMIHHAMGSDELALASLGQALASSPSNPWCLDYQKLLQTEKESYASPYKRDWRKIEIPATLDLSRANYVKLLEQKVVKVHQNGNPSETYREAVKVLTEAGVRAQQARGIYYTADSEEVRVLRARVWKPDGTFYDAPAPEYRSTASASDADEKLYGDSFVCILRFPALEKNSVVEIEYEKETKGENIYADYYGDLFFAGDTAFEPTVRSEYVLITPKNREFYWKYTPPNYPASVSREHIELRNEPEVTEAGGERTYHWTFSHLPTLPREPLMPFPSETLPYVKVSTFKTWDDLMAWYWNLIREQFIPGAVLKQRVTQVLDAYRKAKGIGIEKPLSDWDKVRAVNSYVNTGVRYLGLEFGVHGYKPHKVDEICNAQYGDCKDKAALAVAMLAEAGVSANMILLRTTDRGEIDYELPLFIGLFNHAIYFIPNLDGKPYWIDGTATFFDAAELPPGDFGANTLVVKPGGGYEFIRVPVPAAEDNGGLYATALELDADGNAKGLRSSEYRGVFNPIIRRTYENASKAKELTDQMLTNRYPGAQAANLQLSDLADYSNPESISFEIQVPQFAARQGSRYAVPSTLFEESLSRRYAQLSTREFDLVLPYPWSKTNTLDLVLPPAMQPASLPPDHALENEFGRYSRKTERKPDGRISIREEIVLRPVRVPKEKYGEFREFCRLVDLYQEEKLTVNVQG